MALVGNSMAVAVIMTMLVAVSMIVPVVVAMVVPVVVAMVVPVVVFGRIDVPSRLGIDNVEFGSHQTALAYLARPYAEAFEAEGFNMVADDFDVGPCVNQRPHEHVAADA
jgi:hypothetical protein